jgi:hypothetical protein
MIIQLKYKYQKDTQYLSFNIHNNSESDDIVNV